MGELRRIGQALEPKTPSGPAKELELIEPDKRLNDDDFRAVLERLRMKPCRGCGQILEACRCPTPATKPQLTLEAMGVREEHRGARLVDFTVEIQGLAGAALGPNGRGALVTGSVGTGKSRLLAAACALMLQRRRPPRYYHARRLFARMSAVYGDGAEETEQRVIDDLSTCDFLAIDDLGHEGKPSEFVIGALHEVVDARHGNYRPTFIATNLTLEELARRYDDAIASRLGSWMPIVMVGEDRRA